MREEIIEGRLKGKSYFFDEHEIAKINEDKIQKLEKSLLNIEGISSSKCSVRIASGNSYENIPIFFTYTKEKTICFILNVLSSGKNLKVTQFYNVNFGKEPELPKIKEAELFSLCDAVKEVYLFIMKN